MTLYRINRDFGIVNKILMDHVPNQTGYITKIQREARLSITDVYTTDPHYPWQNKVESVINISQ